jgi:hypothetical protein
VGRCSSRAERSRPRARGEVAGVVARALVAVVVVGVVALPGRSASGREPSSRADSTGGGLVRRDFNLGDDGFEGVFLAPNHGGARPAVLVIGGS